MSASRLLLAQGIWVRHVSNFLAVHRVRPSEEAAGNSDDDDADTVLDLSVENFREALEPPAREIAAGTKSKLASEELTVAACKRASAAWASSDGTPADGRNPFARSDAKQLLKTARQKRRRPPCDSAAGQQARQPSMSVLESSSRAEKVSAWLAGVAQRQDPSGKAFLNREQLDFVRTVAARVTEEENTGEAENLRHGSPTGCIGS